MKPTRAPSCERAKARPNKLCAQFNSLIEMALNFRIWMNSVKNHDRSRDFCRDRGFQIARQSTLIEALLLARKANPGGSALFTPR